MRFISSCINFPANTRLHFSQWLKKSHCVYVCISPDCSVFAHLCWFHDLAIGTRMHTVILDLHDNPQMFGSVGVTDFFRLVMAPELWPNSARYALRYPTVKHGRTQNPNLSVPLSLLPHIAARVVWFKVCLELHFKIFPPHKFDVLSDRKHVIHPSSLQHSNNKYLLTVCYVPASLLASGLVMRNKIDTFSPKYSLYIQLYSLLRPNSDHCGLLFLTVKLF